MIKPLFHFGVLRQNRDLELIPTTLILRSKRRDAEIPSSGLPAEMKNVFPLKLAASIEWRTNYLEVALLELSPVILHLHPLSFFRLIRRFDQSISDSIAQFSDFRRVRLQQHGPQPRNSPICNRTLVREL